MLKLVESVGLKDAFRRLYPDPLRDPGHTWSPGVHVTFDSIAQSSLRLPTVAPFQNAAQPPGTWQYSIPEPQDRIDLIHYLVSRPLRFSESACILAQ